MSTILIMHFYAQVINISVELFNKKWRGRKNILCNKPKTEVFFENRGHAFSDIEKNFTKTKFQNCHIISFDLGQLEILKVLLVLQNWTQFGTNLHGKF